MFFWLQLGRPHSNDANSGHGAGFFQSHLQSVFFTSATLRLRDLRAGRVALGVTTQGSHRSGRAHISASGSSTDRFAVHIHVVPVAIRSTYVDMLKNLDVFNMLPSIESAGRRFAFLHWVLQGEFPSFNSTIKALRLPATHLAALRFLRLAIPRLHSLSLLLDGRVQPPRPGVGNPASPSGMLPRKQQDLPSSWGTSIIRLHMFQTDAGRTACTRP